jgi:PAS domain S-box-containing protein
MDSDFRFVECNQKALQLLEVDKQDLLGKTPLDFSPSKQPDGADSAEKIKTIFHKVFSGKPQAYEWKYQRSDGTLRDAEMAKVSIVMAGEAHVLSSMHDITDRRHAEREREALIQELETKNEELERFTYTISHDLKNPLVTIKGFLGLLEKDALAGNIERLKEDKLYITHAANKMEQLLDELLELSRVGRVTTPLETLSLNEVVSEALELTQGKIEEQKVAITVSPDLPVIQGERMRLIQLFQNLIDNAITYMGEQEHPCVQIGIRNLHGARIVFIQDNGIGIEPQYQEKIFGLFEQVITDKGGTGIGLAMVKRIVETHGGTIWVESKGTGSGSTFCFTLPGKGAHVV